MSQTVTYSSQVATRMSDVARSMGVSAGSSIKKGAVAQPGNSSNIDESKFVDSDLNVIVSVKVVNQTLRVQPNHHFNIPQAGRIPQSDMRKFHEIYGDCYISGFIEGGELHAVVSIKILDSTKKNTIKASILGSLSANSGSDSRADEQTLSKHLSETETTITVNWSGGGQIKNDNQEWSLTSLYQVASAFPTHVSVSSQKTWAILTPYAQNSTFMEWALSHRITPYDYSHARLQASDLFDMYIGYKHNIRQIQSVLDNPRHYSLGTANNPINITVAELVQARNDMKSLMEILVREIDEWNQNPEDLSLDKISNIIPPEVWATRLPLPSDISPQAREVLQRYASLQTNVFDFNREPGKILAPRPKAFETGELTAMERLALATQPLDQALTGYYFESTPVAMTSTSDGVDIPLNKLRDEIRLHALFASQGRPSGVYLAEPVKPGVPVWSFRLAFGDIGEGDPNLSNKATGPQGSGPQEVHISLGDRHLITSVNVEKIVVGTDEMISSLYFMVDYLPSSGKGLFLDNSSWAKSDPNSRSVGSIPSQEFLAKGDCGLAFLIPTRIHPKTGAIGRILLAWK